MADKKPWVKWFWADWKADPAVRACSLTARGLWLEMLSIMDEATPYGHLLINGHKVAPEQLVNQAGGGITVASVRKMLDELRKMGVFSETEDGVIFNRRMVRDRANDTKDVTNGAGGGGNPNIRRGTVPKDQRVRPYRRSDSPAKTKRIFDREGGRCHWCQTELVWDGDLVPNLFHVDHVLPICDGGTNDEDNLVAACADCNHKRARVSVGTDGPTYINASEFRHRQQLPTSSDSKAQKPEARGQRPESQAQPPDSVSRSTEAIALGHEVLRILGRNPAETMHFGKVHAWLESGYKPEEIKAVAAMVGDRMKPDIRDPLSYLGKAMPDEVAKLRAAASTPAGDAGPPETAVHERWRARYRGFKRNETWLDAWGAKPGEPGCECPHSVIDEVDLEIPGFLKRTA